MTEIKVNSDLLKCENDFFTEESKTKSLLITKSAKKNAISGHEGQQPIKTQLITSSVMSRAKQFLDFAKTDTNVAEKCDLVDENAAQIDGNEDIVGKQLIEMNLMLFENKKHLNDDTSDNESESTDTSDSSSEDSEEDSTDSEQQSHNDSKHENKDK